MAYENTKVYFDGGHYIAIPHTTRPQQKRKEKIETEKEIELKQIADKVFKESKGKGKKYKAKRLIQEITKKVDNENLAMEYSREYMNKQLRNLIERRKRLVRKIYIGNWNYFCTFTYNDKLHNEDSFKRKLKDCFKKLSYRKGWIYIGVWERSPKNERLHFHGIFYIPEGTMVGELIEVNDYSFNSHKRQITMQNTHFNKRFGRSDFKPIDRSDPRALRQAARYLMKYLEKSGERIVYSKNTPTYFVSDILNEDVACTMGDDDYVKLVLFDDFSCWSEGCYMGKVSPETISKMRKVN